MDGAAEAMQKPTKAKADGGRMRKESLMRFREGHVHMALKLLSFPDDEAGSNRSPVPRITFLVDGKYVRMPPDKVLLEDLGRFMVDLSTVLEGMDIPKKTTDVESVKERIRSITA